MVKVNDELYVIQLPIRFGDVERVLNLSVIKDPVHGLSLVDTGLPGQAELIAEALSGEGFSLAEVNQVILTHQDIDHVGSLHALKQQTGATVFAYVDEAPYIDGTLPLVKMPPPERLAESPELSSMVNLFRTTEVDATLQDGDVIPGACGALAVATPGHTPGHMSLFLPNTKTLIAGDALTAESGSLAGPSSWATPNMAEAQDSVKKLAALGAETVICYHGGVVANNATAQLTALADRLHNPNSSDQ